MRFLIAFGKISPYILAITMPAFILLVILYSLVFSASSLSSDKSTFILIPDHPDDNKLAAVLVENNLVSSEFIGEILISKQKKKLSEPKVIQGGEYEIKPRLTPSEVIASILNGKPVQRVLSIVGGMTVSNIVNLISDSGLFTKEEIEAAFSKTELLVKKNIPASIPEGYFVPLEQAYSKPADPDKVADELLKKSESIRKSLFPNIAELAFNLNLDEYKILIIASLIEKSGASNLAEKKKVSSVIHNRLALLLPQENEMALKYQAGGFDKPISPTETKRPSPYNTYLRAGLPPTPICTPSLESITAALNPEDTDYLFYLSNGYSVVAFGASQADLSKYVTSAGRS